MWPRERPRGRRLPRSGAWGRGAVAASRAPAAARCDPESQPGPHRAARICFRVANQVMRGALGTRGSPPWSRAGSLSAPWRRPCKPSRERGGRRLSGLRVLETPGLGASARPLRRRYPRRPRDTLRSWVYRHVPGRSSAGVHSPNSSLHFKAGFFWFGVFFKRVLRDFVSSEQGWIWFTKNKTGASRRRFESVREDLPTRCCIVIALRGFCFVLVCLFCFSVLGHFAWKQLLYKTKQWQESLFHYPENLIQFAAVILHPTP